MVIMTIYPSDLAIDRLHGFYMKLSAIKQSSPNIVLQSVALLYLKTYISHMAELPPPRSFYLASQNQKLKSPLYQERNSTNHRVARTRRNDGSSHGRQATATGTWPSFRVSSSPLPPSHKMSSKEKCRTKPHSRFLLHSRIAR